MINERHIDNEPVLGDTTRARVIEPASYDGALTRK